MSRTDKLGLRDRSLVTLTALISQGITDSSLTYHLQTARQNSITRTEIAEIITHIGFYAGWPKALAAFQQAKEVWAEDTAADDARSAFQREMIFPVGEPNTAYAKYFIGNSYLAPVSTEQVPVANVTFDPGRRTDADRSSRQRLVSGRRETCRTDSSRNGNSYSCRGQALARSGSRQLVCSSGFRSSGRKHFQRMAGACFRRRIW